jgi:hypothetical protein
MCMDNWQIMRKKCNRCGYELTRGNILLCYGTSIDLKLRLAENVLDLMNITRTLNRICVENPSATAEGC